MRTAVAAILILSACHSDDPPPCGDRPDAGVLGYYDRPPGMSCTADEQCGPLACLVVGELGAGVPLRVCTEFQPAELAGRDCGVGGVLVAGPQGAVCWSRCPEVTECHPEPDPCRGPLARRVELQDGCACVTETP